MIEVFLQSLLIGYSGAMMPGSLLTYTLDKSIKTGAKAGFLISAGHALLELALVILIFLGVGKYLGTTVAQMIIGILGGLVLIFFGAGMIRDIAKGNISIDFNKPADGKYGNIVVGGALISASNPYFIIWWAAVGLGLIMNAYNSFGIAGVALFYFLVLLYFDIDKQDKDFYQPKGIQSNNRTAGYLPGRLRVKLPDRLCENSLQLYSLKA